MLVEHVKHFRTLKVAELAQERAVAAEDLNTRFIAHEQLAFVLGHALYMKAIHGGKAKNDKIDISRRSDR